MERGQRQREWRLANPDKIRAQRERRRTRMRSRHSGLRRVDRAALLAAQGGQCAICRTGDAGRGWHGDHDHKTKAVRGVLCHGCNVGLGFMKDDPVRLRAAADYVERHAKLQALL